MLLTGKAAHEFKTRTFTEYEKVVCKDIITRPSQTLRDLNEEDLKNILSDRSTTIVKLKKVLTGDLDNILMMALRKDPERR